MSEDYYDVAWINGDNKALLHGRRIGGAEIEQWLTADERNRVLALHDKHQREMERLLKEIAA